MQKKNKNKTLRNTDGWTSATVSGLGHFIQADCI